MIYSQAPALFVCPNKCRDLQTVDCTNVRPTCPKPIVARRHPSVEEVLKRWAKFRDDSYATMPLLADLLLEP